MSVEHKVEVRNTELRTLLLALFNDDNGISEHAHDSLIVMLDTMFPQTYPRFVSEILSKIEATDGRFYLPED